MAQGLQSLDAFNTKLLIRTFCYLRLAPDTLNNQRMLTEYKNAVKVMTSCVKDLQDEFRPFVM